MTAFLLILIPIWSFIGIGIAQHLYYNEPELNWKTASLAFILVGPIIQSLLLCFGIVIGLFTVVEKIFQPKKLEK